MSKTVVVFFCKLIFSKKKEDFFMEVSYKKLFKLLIDRDMKKKDLQEATGLSSSSITKLAKDEYVSMEVIVKVCKALSVDVGDVMEIVFTQNAASR